MIADTLKSVLSPAVLRLAKRKALTARKILTQCLYHICRQHKFPPTHGLPHVP
jgi:hypothetical protein